MFAGAGRAYVYRSYGVHWLLNLVCGELPGAGEAVLLRALRPTHGLELMRARRRGAAERLLCAGPGRLAQALAIGPELDGAPIGGGRIALLAGPPGLELATSPRVGISKAVERPWRYALAGSPYVSRPWPWSRPRDAASRPRA
jgi:DNA-3-methyladenine glycosylase